MSLVQDVIPNFIGGVSQQADTLKFPNQARDLINMIPDPTKGLTKRKPTQHIARLMDTTSVQPLIYTVNKEDEQYMFVLTGSTARVFDLEGNEKTLNIEVGDDEDEDEVREAMLEYLTVDNPVEDMCMINIGDYTFLVNKTVEAELSDETYPDPYPATALVFVKQGDLDTDYKITLNSTTVTYATDEEDTTTIKTNTIAKELYDDLSDSFSTSTWSFYRCNSTIRIQNKNEEDFEIYTTDSNGDRNLFCIYKEFDSVTDLPACACDGFIVKIIGDDGDTSDDYYVQFNTQDGSTWGTGTWQECPSPDVTYHPLPETMPHAFVRQSDGTFVFKTIDWTDRKAGDEDSAATPSIFGEKIEDMFCHKGRLGFLAGDKSIFTDSDDIFSLFKRTVMTSLDTDPIDVGSNSKMVLLKHTLPYDGDILLFSPSTIFTLQGGDVFSNSTVSIDLTMEYPCSSLCKPISAGSSGIFVFENGDYSGLYEIYTNSSYVVTARNITEQVPCYLPAHIFKMAGSTVNNFLGLLSWDEPTAIYVYDYYYSSDAKVQSAWHKWTFDTVDQVLNIDFIDNWMYLTMQYSDGIYLEKMNCTPEQTDTDLKFLVHLDRKIIDTGTYDEETECTTYTLPYEAEEETLNVVDAETGWLLDFTKEDDVLTIEGDFENLIIGLPYTSYWEWSTIYKKQTSGNSTQTVEGLLMLKDLQLEYSASGFFTATVEPLYIDQDPSEFVCTCTSLGTHSAIINVVAIESGVFIIPVMAKNDEVTISITNDTYLPSTFNQVTWLGELYVRGQ